MSLSSRFTQRCWIVFLVCAGAFLVWTNHARIRRVDYVSGLAGSAPSPDASSPTGYAGAWRALIVPERDEISFAWIAQTQQMFAQAEPRVRWVDSDNAPGGREVRAPSPYRWWLGSIAWVDHIGSGRSIGLSVERAALYADPILHGLMLLGLTWLVASRCGGFAAALFATGLVTLYPFAAGMLAGVPDHHGLARFCGLGAVLLAVAGCRDGRRRSRWFLLSGVAGGLGLWINVPTLVPILLGMVGGGLIVAGLVRRTAIEAATFSGAGRAWQLWSWAGATTVLVGSLAEYFPHHLAGWHLATIHPLYGVAWLGFGGVLAKADAWSRREKLGWKSADLLPGLLMVAAIAAVPAVMYGSGNRGYLARDLLSLRLTNQPGGVVAYSFQNWLSRDGLTATVWATLLPLAILVPAVRLLVSGQTKLEVRASLAVALGPVLVALGFASQQLAWWSVLGGVLLVLLVAATADNSTLAAVPPRRWLGVVIVAAFAVAGVLQLRPPGKIDSTLILTPSETEELVERDLAHWLAFHGVEKDAVVFAPPRASLTLGFYGGLRGIGTFAAENSAGFGASLLITSAKTMEEVQTLLQARSVRYVVIPSWDPFFEEFGQLYLAKNFSNRKSFLADELRRWNLPLWLKPVAYPMPVIGGFENQSVQVFEVVDEQSPAVAASRLADYFVETGQLDRAATLAETLRRFPGDAGALAARAGVLHAKEDAAAFAQTVDLLSSRLAQGADRFLPWDRRVSVAVALAQANRIEPARAQVRRCLAELDEQRLKSLSNGALFKLLVLSRAFQIEIPEPKLRALALELLPPELRANL